MLNLKHVILAYDEEMAERPMGYNNMRQALIPGLSER
jgi:hypothetical protein